MARGVTPTHAHLRSRILFLVVVTVVLDVVASVFVPISTLARVLDIFLQAYAISVVVMLAGSFGASFNRRGVERDPLAAPSQ